MADYKTIRSSAGSRSEVIDSGLRAHMNKVYGTMSVGMLITALAAWAISGLATTTDPSYATAQMANGTLLTALGSALYLSPLRWIIMLAPLGILFFGFGHVMRKSSAAAAQLLFFVFASLIGISLSSIFIVYTSVSIVQTFLVTSIIMGVIGIIIASIINIFLGSPALMFAISIIGLLVFAGLTAYDTQNIKIQYLQHAHHGDQQWLDKSAIHGALSLYLDFLNMFQFLLMFMGNQE